MEITAIRVSKETRDMLAQRKTHPRQSMDEVIRELLAKTAPAAQVHADDQEVSPHALPTHQSPE